jgi:hypothetical protein
MAKPSDRSPYLGLASLGLTLAGGLAANRVHRAEATLREAQVAGANSNRLAKNIERGAEAGLADYLQSVNNNRRMKAAAAQLTSGTQNMVRNQDSMVTSSIEQQLMEAERQGAYAANVAKVGVGGNSVDMIDVTMKLKNSRQRAAITQNNKYINYDMVTQLAGIMPQTIQGLDRTITRASFDHSTNMAFTPDRTGNAFFDMLSNPSMQDVMGFFTQSKEEPTRLTSGDISRMDRKTYPQFYQHDTIDTPYIP